jgi:hypothetical protein
VTRPTSWKTLLQKKRQQALELKEFVLMLSHPQIFVSYRAAKAWALAEIKDDENSHWIIQVVKENDLFCCCISQPSWPGDHCGTHRATAALAVTQAVMELQVGF